MTTRGGEAGGRAGAGAVLAGAALAWLGGVAAQLAQAALYPTAWYGAGIVLGALCLGAACRVRWRFVAVLIGMTLLGFGATGLQASWRLADSLAAAIEGRDVTVTGVVASLPQPSASGLRFRFRVELATSEGQPVVIPPLVSLGWYVGFGGHAQPSAQQRQLGAGQRWRFTVRLRRPHGNINPHGFDYELQLFERGVRATGYVREAPAPVLIDAAAGHPIERLRQHVRDAIDAAIPDRRAAGVLTALSIGDQSAIEREDWEVFRTTGVGHLMSISGLHVTMFAWLAAACIGALWRRSERAMLWQPAPQAARWGGLACALAYALFSGFGVPAQRTVWMLATVTLLQSAGVRWPWPLVMLASAVVVTALDPWALLQPGFWLSFVAVGLLMASSPVFAATVSPEMPAGWHRLGTSLGRLVRGGLRTQLIATFGLAPLSLVFFQQLSVVGFFANLLAIPLVTLVITPLALLGTLATPLWRLGAWVVTQMSTALGWLAQWPGALWSVPAAEPWAQAAGLLAAALLVMPWPWRLRALAVPLAVPLLLAAPVRPPAGEFEMLAVDVGQGTSVLVRTREHLLVYDAGPAYSSESDAGQRVLLPLLRARGETRIDVLMLSHRDADHVGGAAALLQALSVRELHSSLEDGHALRATAAAHRRCEAGDTWKWDGVQFEVLHPPAASYAATLKPNARSCVLRVRAANGATALLTGDIERAQELALAEAGPAVLHADVMLVPHHGSRTSSIARFIDAVHPQLAVVQAGYRSRFGHPAPDVVTRYRERGIAVLESARCGAMRWSSEHRTPVCERDAVRRYWHHPDETRTP